MLLDKDNQPIVFTGTADAAWDTSNRVMMPSKWQPQDRTVRFHVLPWPVATEDYLLVLPPERWQMMLDRVASASLDDEDMANLERHIAGGAHQFVLDNVGRFSLPAEFAARVGCKRPLNPDGSENKKAAAKVVLVGRLNKFEIWSAERFEAKRLVTKQAAIEALKSKSVNL